MEQSMELKEWNKLRALPLGELRCALRAMALPSSIGNVEWSIHPKLNVFDEQPGILLISSIWFENGYSATAVFGCEPSLLEPAARAGGPWPLTLGLAAKCGDEVRPLMMACFGKRGPPVLGSCDPLVNVGSKGSVVESCEVGEIEHALHHVKSLASAWDSEGQAKVWKAARSGSVVDLKLALAAEPNWIDKKWSKGSCAQALCVRLGHWEAAKCFERTGSKHLAGPLIRSECSKALADFCKDVSVHWPLGAARKALLLAWNHGVALDEGVFCRSFGREQSSQNQARAQWHLAERAWLGDGECFEQAGNSKRL